MIFFVPMARPIFSGSLLLFLVLLFHKGYADMFVGGDTTYTIQEGDSLILIGSRLGVNWQRIARENQMELDKPLKIGHRLKVNTKRIVPRSAESGIIVNIPDRMLYYLKEGKVASAFPVGLGKPDWETPTGAFTILGRERNPIWHVPLSIREEVAAKGEIIERTILPGPDNPLGRYALRTSIAGLLLHETIWPTSVYQFRSHACIRILPEHMEKFFQDVRVGTQGEIIYEPVKVALTPEGRIFLEIHRDIYKKGSSVDSEVRKLFERRGLSGRVNWEKVDKVLQEKPDFAEDVTS